MRVALRIVMKLRHAAENERCVPVCAAARPSRVAQRTSTPELVTAGRGRSCTRLSSRCLLSRSVGGSVTRRAREIASVTPNSRRVTRMSWRCHARVTPRSPVWRGQRWPNPSAFLTVQAPAPSRGCPGVHLRAAGRRRRLVRLATRLARQMAGRRRSCQLSDCPGCCPGHAGTTQAVQLHLAERC
jgi:hypothetical protein